MTTTWVRAHDGTLIVGDGEDNTSFEMDGDLLLVNVQRVSPPDAAGRGGGSRIDRFSLHQNHLPALIAYLTQQLHAPVEAECPACDGRGHVPRRPVPQPGTQSDIEHVSCGLCEDGTIHVQLTGPPTQEEHEQ